MPTPKILQSYMYKFYVWIGYLDISAGTFPEDQLLTFDEYCILMFTKE